MESASNTQANAERREFRMHKDMLWSVIKSQAGTFDKAVLELMMNAVDAGATEVRFEFDGKSFRIRDDGKGFVSRDEIESFFETFGTPHKTGDATFGKFRMGRGQVMAFTRNQWRSGVFSMSVDIREKGLAYDLVTLPEKVEGCSIAGELYEPMMPSDTIRTVDGLSAMCKYLPIPAYINGKRVSEAMSSIKWTMEDDDAYYLLKPEGRTLDVFNLGVLVRRYHGAQAHGVGGIVVSRSALEVNFARNDIITSSCEVWKRVSTKLKAYSAQFEEKRPSQNEPYREMMLDRLLSGAFDSPEEMAEAFNKAKVVTDYSGKHFSFASLANRVFKTRNLIAPEVRSRPADRVHQAQLATVLSPQFMDRVSDMNIHAMLQRIDHNLMMYSFNAYQSERIQVKRLIESIRTLEEVAGAINDTHDIVDEKILFKEERLALKIISDMSSRMAWSLELGIDGVRAIRVCNSETVEGFTDGKTVIFIDRKYLKVPGYTGALFSHFDEVKHLLIHEYMHSSDDSTGHGHPAEFYEAYHDATANKLHSMTYDAVRLYITERRRAGLKMRGGDLTAVDLVGVDASEEVQALGFNSMTAMNEHEGFLQDHGTPEYKQWRDEVQHTPS